MKESERGRTHWEGCYESHHDCAVALIKDQQERIAELEAERRRDALDGQAALDDRDKRIAKLERENAGLLKIIESSALRRRGYRQALDTVLALPRISAIKGGNGYEWIEEEGEDGRYIRVSDIEEKLREGSDER